MLLFSSLDIIANHHQNVCTSTYPAECETLHFEIQMIKLVKRQINITTVWRWVRGAEVFIIISFSHTTREMEEMRSSATGKTLQIRLIYFLFTFRIPFVLIFPINILFSYFLSTLCNIIHSSQTRNLTGEILHCLGCRFWDDVAQWRLSWGQVRIISCELIKVITTFKIWQISHASHGRIFQIFSFTFLCFHTSFSLASDPEYVDNLI